jgi:uridylate kinase
MRFNIRGLKLERTTQLGGVMGRYSRVILKLSGEFFSDGFEVLCPERFTQVCWSIERLVEAGVEVCVIVGGGNILRGVDHEKYGVDKVAADRVGMIATGVNAGMLASMLEERGVAEPVLFGNGPVSLGKRWSHSEARATLSQGRVAIVAGGWGRPLVSTDYPAVGFAKEVDAQAVLMAKNGVDGVYSSDPRLDDKAEFIPVLSIQDALDRDLKVMDRMALDAAREHGIIIHIFAASDVDAPVRITQGESVGTIILPEESMSLLTLSGLR